MNVKRLLVRLAREVPCLVSLVIFLGVNELITQRLFGLDIPVSWQVECLIWAVFGVGWALLERWFIRRELLRAEHLSFLSIESALLVLPVLPFYVMAAPDIGIAGLAGGMPIFVILAVRIISWRVCKAEKHTLHQGWLVLGGIVSELLVLLINWGCSITTLEQSTWWFLLLFAVLLLGRFAVEKHLVRRGILRRGERTALAWLDGTHIVMTLATAVQFLRSDPAYLLGLALTAGLCAVMVCAAVFARKKAE